MTKKKSSGSLEVVKGMNNYKALGPNGFSMTSKLVGR